MNRKVGRAVPGDFASALTDFSGGYTLLCLDAGPYFCGAFLYGYRIATPLPGTPVTIPTSGTAMLDFVLEALPHIRISATIPAASEGRTNEGFILTRSGTVTEPLEVWFQVSGTAQPDDFGGDLSLGRVTIPAGTNAQFIAVTLRRDAEVEEPETLVVTAVAPGQIQRQVVAGSVTNWVTFYYPGWELRSFGAEQRWFQTDPAYSIAADSTATFTILDGPLYEIPRISVFAGAVQPREHPPTASHFRITRQQRSTNDEVHVYFVLGGQAINGVDYELVRETATLPAGATEVLVPIQPFDDDLPEGDEHVFLVLWPQPTYVIERDFAEMFIKDSEIVVHRLAFGELFGSGDKVLQVFGEFGRTFVIETSTNLVHWQPFETNVITFYPTTVYIPPFWWEAARFYKSYLLPP